MNRNVPPHWKMMELREVAEVVTGSTPSTVRDDFFGGEIPFVTPTELKGGIPVIKTPISLTELGAKQVRVIPENSVMVCCIGSLGKIGIAGTRLATNQQINSLVFDERIVYPRYGFHYCQTLKPLLIHLAPSTTVPIINKGRFQELQIPLPPLHEQKRIGAILDKADSIRRKRQEAVRLTEELMRSVFLDMFGDPVTNPKGWNIKKFEEIGSLDRGVSKHRPRNAPQLLGGQYPLIQTGEVANSDGYIRSYKNTYSEVGLKQSKIWPASTLCITIAANIAKTGILTFDACFPDSVVGFTPNSHATTEYVQYWLSFLQKILEDTAPESAQKNINLEILRNLDIPLPPMQMQTEFSIRVKRLHEMKAKQSAGVDDVETLFNSLMNRAFKEEL